MIYSEAHLNNMPWLPSHTLLLVKGGSRAYGLDTPTSDYDFKGIAIAPAKCFSGYLNKFVQAEIKTPEIDGCIYNLPRFFELASACNPNIIEILWSEQLYVSPIGRKLLNFREAFVSKKARFTFSGYAVAQLKRIRSHRKWLLDPPLSKPTRVTFGLPEATLISKDLMGAIEAVGAESFPAHVMETYSQERRYHNALQGWSQYETWKKNRNPARAEVERKYGYDCKHAMHLVRLMRMCREILSGQGVIVKREHDREELLAVKNGAWSYEKLMEFAETSDKELESLYNYSGLQREPNHTWLNDRCSELVEEMNWTGSREKNGYFIG